LFKNIHFLVIRWFWISESARKRNLW